MSNQQFLHQFEQKVKSHINKEGELNNRTLRLQHLIDSVGYDDFRRELESIRKYEDNLASKCLPRMVRDINRMTKDISNQYRASSLHFSQLDGQLKYNHEGTVGDQASSITKVKHGKSYVEQSCKKLALPDLLDAYESIADTMTKEAMQRQESLAMDDLDRMVDYMDERYVTDMPLVCDAEIAEAFLDGHQIDLEFSQLNDELIDAWLKD